jgi:hypothetical protein
VTVHRSAYPGAGKSFNIRLEASQHRQHYVHVPINRRLSAQELVAALRENPDFQGKRERRAGRDDP